MKFIKGFVVTIALYVGLSLLFTIIGLYLVLPESVSLLFSSLDSIAPVFYWNLANPVILSVFQRTEAYIADPTNLSLLFVILGAVVPVIVAALIGSFAEKKSGSVKYIFLSSFIGLLVAAAIGMILQIVGWMPLGVPFDTIAKFLTGGLIMSALNAFIWCAIGVFITSKGWG
jgi:uncharacterized protein YacL